MNAWRKRIALSLMSKTLLQVAVSIVLGSSAGAVSPQQMVSESAAEAIGVRLTVDSAGLTGYYRCSVKEALDSLTRLVQLTYAAPPATLDEPISGTLVGASLSDALRQMLSDFNFIVDRDVESGTAHVYLLGRVPGDVQAHSPLSAAGLAPQVRAARPEREPPATSDSGLENLSPQMRAQFEVANQNNTLPPELAAQFAVAHQRATLSPELEAQFAVANQQTSLAPEIAAQFAVADQDNELEPALAAQFDVAHQNPVLSPELQAQFDVALARGSPQLSGMSYPAPATGTENTDPELGFAPEEDAAGYDLAPHQDTATPRVARPDSP